MEYGTYGIKMKVRNIIFIFLVFFLLGVLFGRELKASELSVHEKALQWYQSRLEVYLSLHKDLSSRYKIFK